MICMICTCLSVVLHDLQELNDLQDLYYLAGVYLRGLLMCVICTYLPGGICMTKGSEHSAIARNAICGTKIDK